MKKHDIHSRHVHSMTPEWRKQLRKGYAQPCRRRCRFLMWAVICAAVLAGSFLLAANLGGCANRCDYGFGYPAVGEANHREHGERFSGHLLGLLPEPNLNIDEEEYQ